MKPFPRAVQSRKLEKFTFSIVFGIAILYPPLLYGSEMFSLPLPFLLSVSGVWGLLDVVLLPIARKRLKKRANSAPCDDLALELMVAKNGTPVALTFPGRTRFTKDGIELFTMCAVGQDAHKIPANVIKSLIPTDLSETIKIPEIDAVIGWMPEKDFRRLNTVETAAANNNTQDHAIRLAQETVSAYNELNNLVIQ